MAVLQSAKAETSPVAKTSNPAAPTRGSKIIGAVCVLATAIGWGLNWPATKFVLAICPPLSARGLSGLVACLGLLAIASVRGETIIVPRHLWGRLALLSLLNVSVWMGFTTASMLWLPAGQAATLAYTMPIWTTLLSWYVLAEPPDGRQILATLLGVAAICVLVGGTGLTLNIARLPGFALALSAAGLFAFGTVLSKKTPVPLPPVALTGWQVGIGSLPLLASGTMIESPHWRTMPAIGWAALAYTAFVSMGLCYLLWFAAVRRLKASVAAIGTLLTPVVGVVASSVALGDPLTTAQVVSLGCVALGIILSVKTANQTPRPDQPPRYSREGISSRANR